MKAVYFTAAVILLIMLTALTAFAAVMLISAGLVSVFVALGAISGIIKNLASDLAPPVILFTGLFCVFTALSVATALYIFCPKGVRRFIRLIENYFA